MIDEAIILGQLGKAVYKEDGVFWETSASDPNNRWRCDRFDLDVLFAHPSEVHIPRKGIQREELHQALAHSSTAHTALSLVLCTLDPDLSWETKVECLETSEELLQDSSTYQFVRWRM